MWEAKLMEARAVLGPIDRSLSQKPALGGGTTPVHDLNVSYEGIEELQRQPEIHLFAAHFKEQHGDIAGARAAYKLVYSEISPGLIEAIINHANMEKRLEKMEDAFSLYEQAISIEKGKEQYSRFIMLNGFFHIFICMCDLDAGQYL